VNEGRQGYFEGSEHGGKGRGGGANIKSFVTNDETKFKNLTFWTY